MRDRRHNSWPSSSYASEIRAEGPQPLSPVNLLFHSSRKKQSQAISQFVSNREFTPSPDLSLYSSSDEEEFLSSAGIVDGRNDRNRLHLRRRRRQEVIRKRDRRRFENHTANDMSDDEKEVASGSEEIIISTITQASNTPSARLRRFLLRRWSKTRRSLVSFHILPRLIISWTGTSRSLNPTDTNRRIKARYVTKLTSTSQQSILEAALLADDEEWMMRPGRRHRRCHSEQPRSWREPNPGLWTLAEE